jgi:hypothetical protein
MKFDLLIGIGCSYTFGHGLYGYQQFLDGVKVKFIKDELEHKDDDRVKAFNFDLSNSWVSHLSKQLGCEYLNLGSPGASIEEGFRIITQLFSEKPIYWDTWDNSNERGVLRDNNVKCFLTVSDIDISKYNNILIIHNLPGIYRFPYLEDGTDFPITWPATGFNSDIDSYGTQYRGERLIDTLYNMYRELTTKFLKSKQIEYFDFAQKRQGKNNSLLSNCDYILPQRKIEMLDNFTIRAETKGKLDDSHWSLKGYKVLSHLIYEQLKGKYNGI